MDSDTNQPSHFIDRQALQSIVESRLKTKATVEALDALAHSAWCVLTQHLDAGRNGLKQEVADRLIDGTFEDIPHLEPRHFLPSHQHLFDSIEVPETGYEPGPSVRPRR